MPWVRGSHSASFPRREWELFLFSWLLIYFQKAFQLQPGQCTDAMTTPWACLKTSTSKNYRNTKEQPSYYKKTTHV